MCSSAFGSDKESDAIERRWWNIERIQDELPSDKTHHQYRRILRHVLGFVRWALEAGYVHDDSIRNIYLVILQIYRVNLMDIDGVTLVWDRNRCLYTTL